MGSARATTVAIFGSIFQNKPAAPCTDRRSFHLWLPRDVRPSAA